MTIATKTFLLPVLAIGLVLAGCSDDDDGGGGGGDLAAFCELSESLGDVPSDDEAGELRDAAPGEIADDVDTLLDALESGDFESDGVIDAGVAVESFIADNCGDSGSGDDIDGSENETEGDDGAPDDGTEDADADPDDGDMMFETSGSVPTDACGIDTSVIADVFGKDITSAAGASDSQCLYSDSDGLVVQVKFDAETGYTEEQFRGLVIDDADEEVFGVGDLAAYETFAGDGRLQVLVGRLFITIDVFRLDATAAQLVELYDSMS